MKPIYLTLLLFTLLAGCASVPTTTSSPETSTDAAVEPAPAADTRVVALSSIAADIIHRLDSSKLVGIPGSQLLNQNEALQDLPRVSEGRTQPNLETVVALEPTLVVGATGFHDQALTSLESVGVETLSTELDSWQSLEDLTRTLATAIGADPEPLLQQYQQCLPAQPAAAEADTLVLVSREPLLSPNKDSWAGDLLTQFGATNLVAEFQGQSPIAGYVTLSPEKVLETNPEILILVDIQGSEVDAFQSEPFWQDLNAVQNDQVHILDYYGFVNAGSIDSITQACEQLTQIYETN